MIDVTPEFLTLHKILADIDSSVADHGADQALARIDELLAAEEKDEHKVFANWMRARITKESAGIAAAVQHYETAINLANDKLAAAIRYELGIGWRHAGEAGEAESVLRRTAEDARGLREWGTVARAVEHLSGMAGDGDLFDEARKLAWEADEAWAKTNEVVERARGLRRLGELEERCGELQKAKEAFRSASWLYAEAGEPGSNIEVQCQLSSVLTDLGDENGAIEVARSAAAFAALIAPQTVPFALYALALSLDDNKDYWEEAESTFLRAYEEGCSRKEFKLAAQSSGDLAGLLAAQGRLDAALLWNSRSERHYSEVGHSRGVVICAGNASRFYELLGRFDERVSALRRALDEAKTAGFSDMIPDLSRRFAEAVETPEAHVDSLVVLLDYVQRGILKQAASGEEYDEQARLFVDGLLDKLSEAPSDDEQALNMVIRLVRSTTVAELAMSVALAGHALGRWQDLGSPLVPWLRFELAKLLARLGDHEAARAIYLEAYGEAKSLGDVNLQVAVAGNLALSCQQLDLVEEAERVLEESIPVAKTKTEADSLRLNLAANYMRFWNFEKAEPILNSVLNSARERGDGALIACSAANLACVLSDTGREVEALEYLPLVDEKIAEVAAHEVPELMRLKAIVLERAGESAAAMAAYDEMATLTEEQQQSLSTPALQTVYLSSRQHFFAGAVELAVETDPAKGLYLAQVGRTRAMAQSISGPGNVHSVPRDLASRLRARLSSTEAAVAYYLGERHLLIWCISSAGVSVERVDVTGEELERLTREYRLSLGADSEDTGIQAQLSGLLIEPFRAWLDDYKTLYISPHGPLHNLPFAALGESRRLVQSHNIALVPALHLLDQKPSWSSSWRDKPLIVGDPSGNLPAAADEAKAVARGLERSILLLAADATKDELVKRLNEASLLHLACHARFDADDPFNSGVELASQAGGVELLTLPEIFRLEQSA